MILHFIGPIDACQKLMRHLNVEDPETDVRVIPFTSAVPISDSEEPDDYTMFGTIDVLLGARVLSWAEKMGCYCSLSTKPEDCGYITV